MSFDAKKWEDKARAIQAERFKGMIKCYGVSQAKFAKMCGITEATLSSYVCGRRLITPDMAKKIAERINDGWDSGYHPNPAFPAAWIMCLDVKL